MQSHDLVTKIDILTALVVVNQLNTLPETIANGMVEIMTDDSRYLRCDTKIKHIANGAYRERVNENMCDP